MERYLIEFKIRRKLYDIFQCTMNQVKVYLTVVQSSGINNWILLGYEGNSTTLGDGSGKEGNNKK